MVARFSIILMKVSSQIRRNLLFVEGEGKFCTLIHVQLRACYGYKCPYLISQLIPESGH